MIILCNNNDIYNFQRTNTTSNILSLHKSHYDYDIRVQSTSSKLIHEASEEHARRCQVKGQLNENVEGKIAVSYFFKHLYL